jgi:ribosomal protein S18 acetylase RimI-like enzyme
VRQARPDEAPALARFAAEAFTTTYAPYSRAEDVAAYVDAALTPAAFAADLADPAQATFLAVDGAAIVGYAQLRRGGPWPPGARWTSAPPASGAELARLYVAPAAHGSGLAARLLDAACAAARAADAPALWLCAWQGNARALAFYRKHGFAVIGTGTFAMGAEVQEDWVLARALTR